MDPSTDGIPKAKRKRSDVAERKANNKATTTVKMGFAKASKHDALTRYIEEMIHVCSRYSIEASLLFNVHVRRLLESEHQLPKMDQTFFDQLYSAVANAATTGYCNDASILQSLGLLKTCCPEYQSVPRPRNITHLLQQLRVTMFTDFVNMIENTRWKRVKLWFRHCVQSTIPSLPSRQINTLALLMVQAFFGKCSIVELLPRFTSLPAEVTEFIIPLQAQVDELVPLLPSPVDPPEASLPLLHDILKRIEAVSGKSFSLLPIKKHRAHALPISTTILKSLVKCIGDKSDYNDREYELWTKYFFTNKFTMLRRDWEFAHFITTDGVSVNVCLKHTNRKIPNKHTRSSKTTIRHEEKPVVQGPLPQRVVAIDPGKVNIVTGVVRGEGHLEAFKMSTAEWRVLAGIYHRTSTTAKWVSKNESVQMFNDSVPSAKVSGLEPFLRYAAYVLVHLGDCLAFYSARRFRRLRFKTYITGQKAQAELVRRVTGNGSVTHVFFGNADIHNLRGSKPSLGKTVRNWLAKHATIVDQDEFRTSQLCSSCSAKLSDTEFAPNDPKMTIGRWNHRVRQCYNTVCSRILKVPDTQHRRVIWDRDTNAAINILKLGLSQVAGEDPPPEFSRILPQGKWDAGVTNTRVQSNLRLTTPSV